MDFSMPAARAIFMAREAASLCSWDAFMVSTRPLARGQGLSRASQNLRDRCALRLGWTTRLASLKPRAGSSYKAPRGFRSGAAAARRLHPRLGDGRRAAISKDLDRSGALLASVSPATRAGGRFLRFN